MSCRSFTAVSRRWVVALVAALSVAACDRNPAAPSAPAPRPGNGLVGSATGIRAQDLGVLPGDEWSEATHVAEDGTVYGVSYPPGGGASRYFRWTPTGGMVQVASIPLPSWPPWQTFSSVVHPWVKGIVTARNAKGEATGVLCQYDCDDPTAYGGHVFRSSAGAGAIELDTRRDPFFPDVPEGASHGWGINRWGHVAGAYWLSDDPSAFLWTPVDSFRVEGILSVDNGNTKLNDIDQVVAQQQDAIHEYAVVFRPDLSRRALEPDAASLSFPGVEWSTYALAQQTTGTLVVGRSLAFGYDESTGESFYREHAALWRVPALDRAAFPVVNANPYGGSGGLVHLSTGGQYYQLYRATQSSPRGPYLELVDWGDGTSSRRTRSNIGVTTSQVHTYRATGVYWVRVYVKDALGRWGVSERKVTVKP